MDLKERKRVYALEGPGRDPMLFDDRATAHAWAEDHGIVGRWWVTDYPIWTKA